MRKNVNCLLAVAALALLAAQGCKNKDSTSTTRSGSGTASMSGGSTTPTASRSTPSSYTGASSSGMSQTASDAASSAKTSVRDAASDARTATDSAGARASGAAGDTAENTGKAASDASTTTASTTEAQKLLDQASQYIKDNKWDLADQSLTKVEQMKPQLPASYGTKIDATRKLFNTAKSGSNLLGGTGAAGGAAK